jgi:predicted DNA-binding transcriptional regulator YafY
MFLALGPDLEVLAPESLRDRISAAARATAARYTAGGPAI